MIARLHLLDQAYRTRIIHSVALPRFTQVENYELAVCVCVCVCVGAFPFDKLAATPMSALTTVWLAKWRMLTQKQRRRRRRVSKTQTLNKRICISPHDFSGTGGQCRHPHTCHIASAANQQILHVERLQIPQIRSAIAVLHSYLEFSTTKSVVK